MAIRHRASTRRHTGAPAADAGARINRKELVTAVAAHTGLDARDVETVLRGITEVIEAVAAKGEQVTITGFANFTRVDRPARMARNPATGAPVKVKASKKAKITALKGFKDALMSPSAAPKLAKGVWPPKPVVAAPAKTAPALPSKATAAKATSPGPTTASGTRSATKAPAAKSATARKAVAKKR